MKTQWPGSRWWRVDLHAHSPASHDFRGGSAEWGDWVRAARDAGIDAVAVTDHNSASAVGPLQDAAADLEGGPVLFPGVELTASDGSHLLVLMDPRQGQQHVEDLLSRVRVPVEQRGAHRGRSPLSVEEILTECGDAALVIGAHVNGDRGLLQLEGEQRIAVLRHPALAALEVDPSKELASDWIEGRQREVGRPHSVVHASDSHSLGEMGRRFTWIKMTEPTLEGLRLALMDGGESLRHGEQGDPNALHSDHGIESITVHHGKFMGRSSPMRVEFGPWLNAIIGGRGTGKSSLVDFCRKTLRRDAELDGSAGGEEGALRSFFDRRMRVPRDRFDEGLLTDQTCVEVVYRKDNIQFIVSWSLDGDKTPIARLVGAEKTPEDGDIRERFPVRIYSQKQLFSLAQDPNALLAVIDDTPSVRGTELRRAIEQAADRYLALRAAVRAERNRTVELPSRRAEVSDIRRKLDLLQEGGQALALSEHRLRRQQDTSWNAALQGVSEALEKLDRATDGLLVADLELASDAGDDPATTSLGRAHDSLRQTIRGLQDDVRRSVAAARTELQALRDGGEMRNWRGTMEASAVAFREATDRLAAEGIGDPSEYAGLLGRAAELAEAIEDLERAQERADKLEDDATSALDEYRRLRRELSDRRREFVRTTSGELIRIEVNELSNFENLADDVGKILGIERFLDDRQAIASRIRSTQGEVWNAESIDDVVAELRELHSGELDSWPTHDRRFEPALRRVPPERIDRLALYVPEDDVVVRFRDQREGKWQPLARGSPGQQTAALLAFVLGYGTEPIILDQPEDDLDSALIYELLVSRLRETKLSRQVIVITHNPNIVVHGDAELVHSLVAGPHETRIECRGGLQEQVVRDEVCRVMEGGREAFESRFRRIMRLGTLRS
ncbi:MAG: hypothetical protein F4150_01035 [Chloroflexi bacterium]|nr:hypothetical protein [Chloroflexota bacterium]